MNSTMNNRNLTEEEKTQMEKELLALGNALDNREMRGDARVYVYMKHDVLVGWYCPKTHQGTRNCQHYYVHMNKHPRKKVTVEDPKCKGVVSCSMSAAEAFWHFEKALKYAPTIRLEREEKGISFDELVSHLMIPVSLLRDWETGKGELSYYVERYVMEQLQILQVRKTLAMEGFSGL